jgi:hypothetical protein
MDKKNLYTLTAETAVNVAVKPHHVTRHLAEKPVFNADGFVELAKLRNPKQLLDLLSTSDVYVIAKNDKKYYKVTVDNVYDLFAEAVSETGAITVATALEDAAVKALGTPKLYSFFSEVAKEDLTTAKLEGANVEIHSQVIRATNLEYKTGFEGDVKEGYFVPVKFDLMGATSAKYSEAAIVIDGKTKVVLKEGTNIIPVKENKVPLVNLVAKLEVEDNKKVDVTERIDLYVEFLPHDLPENLKKFVEAKPKPKVYEAILTIESDGRTVVSNVESNGATGTGGKKPKKNQGEVSSASGLGG